MTNYSIILPAICENEEEIKKDNFRLQEKMNTEKNQVEGISVTTTIVNVFCTLPGNW